MDNEELKKYEQRWLDGSGQRYMKDGTTIRCQGISPRKLRELRESSKNPSLAPDEAWPEAQCVHAAVPGSYACRFHTAKEQKRSYSTILEYMPCDLAEIVAALLEDPEYISRQLEIRALQGRVAQLYKELDKHEAIDGSAVSKIRDALREIIGSGDVVRGIETIEGILNSIDSTRGIWLEIRKLVDTIQALTRTEVASIQAMRSIATAEQIMALVEGIASTFVDLIEEYVKPNDPELAYLLVKEFVSEVRRMTNADKAEKLLQSYSAPALMPEIVEKALEDE